MKKILLYAVICMVINLWAKPGDFAFVSKASADTIPASEQTQPAQKIIIVSLDSQTLAYYENDQLIKEFKISSGKENSPTPTGEYTVLVKKPTVNYIGANYSYPNTKWNLMFKYNPKGSFYIHGAYWHNKFGQPMSGGCVNVSYANMEALYNWADVGTKIIIKSTADRHPKGSVVTSNGQVYYLGDQIRYLFPSEDVFYSWGHKFNEVLTANPADLAMPLGPTVELKAP